MTTSPENSKGAPLQPPKNQRQWCEHESSESQVLIMQASSANGMLEIQKLVFIHFSHTYLFNFQPHSLQTSLNNPDSEMLAVQMFKIRLQFVQEKHRALIDNGPEQQ